MLVAFAHAMIHSDRKGVSHGNHLDLGILSPPWQRKHDRGGKTGVEHHENDERLGKQSVHAEWSFVDD